MNEGIVKMGWGWGGPIYETWVYNYAVTLWAVRKIMKANNGH